MTEIFLLFRLEFHRTLADRSTQVYLLLCFAVFTSTTLLMEHVIIGSEKGWVSDIQRNLWLRNWMLLPLGYCWIAIKRFVVDRQQGFIQDAIIAGYKRKSILISKILTLMSLSAISLCICVIPTFPYASSSSEIWATFGGLGLTMLTDLMLIGWISIFSMLHTGANRVLLNMVLLIGCDFVMRLMLWIGPGLFDSPVLTWAGEYLPLLLPTSALNCWMLWEDAWSTHTLLIAIIYAILLWRWNHINWERRVY